MEKMQYECTVCGQQKLMVCSSRVLSRGEFDTRFRDLCHDYALGFPCECLAGCISEFQRVLSENRNGSPSLFVESLFSVFLDEFQKECVRRIASFGEICPR